MKPIYPKFKKITLQDKTEIENYLQQFPPYSDYSFFSILSYDVGNDIIFSYLNNNLVIRFRDYISNNQFYSFLGNTEVKETITILLERSKKEHLAPILKLVPYDSVASLLLNTSEYKIEEDRDNSDYIYSVNDICELKNSKYHGQRNFITRFSELFPFCKIKVIDLYEKKIKEDILRLFEIWRNNAHKTEEETAHEFIALQRALHIAKHFKIYAIGVYDRDKLIGFIIADIPNNNKVYAQGHFAKFNSAYRGIFPLLFHNLSVELNNDNYKFINNEQDMGIPGLRNAKEQWHPSYFLKKYTISYL